MSCKCDTINIVNDNNVIVVSHADGRDGKSAYQQAVEGGYTGTEQEFNCSLSLLADVKQVKENLVSAIEYKGGTSSAEKSFQGIAGDIREIPNFPTTGFEYTSEIYRPKTLIEAYNNKKYIKRITDNFIENLNAEIFYYCIYLESVSFPNLVSISGSNTFTSCANLSSVNFPNLVSISGGNTFTSCANLSSVDFPNLVSISGNDVFSPCANLSSVNFPNLVSLSNRHTFNGCPLENIVFGTLVKVAEFHSTKIVLRNITIGQNTDINLPFQNWTATNVIAEGQSGIDELNSNLYNNLLTKLYDHSEDGETRTLRIGWLAKVSQENIDYANSKGWTLTT
jgi:hypothetical protein